MNGYSVPAPPPNGYGSTSHGDNTASGGYPGHPPSGVPQTVGYAPSPLVQPIWFDAGYYVGYYTDNGHVVLVPLQLAPPVMPPLVL